MNKYYRFYSRDDLEDFINNNDIYNKDSWRRLLLLLSNNDYRYSSLNDYINSDRGLICRFTINKRLYWKRHTNYIDDVSEKDIILYIKNPVLKIIEDIEKLLYNLNEKT